MKTDIAIPQIDYLTASRVRVTWQLEEELVSRKLEAIGQKLAKTVRINGFRPGRVPWQRLWKQKRQDIQRAFLDAVIPPLWKELFASGLPFPFTPVDRPRFSKLNPQRGEALTIAAEVDVMPRLNLPRERYAGIRVDVPEEKIISDADVDAWIEERRHYWVTFKQAPEGYPIASGDYLLVRWRERPVVEGADWGQPLQMSLYIHDEHSNRASGFDDALIGMKMGDTAQKRFTVFGQDRAPVEVEIIAIDDHKLRSLASLAEVVKLEGAASVEELRTTVQSRMEAESHLRWLTIARRAIIEKIIREHFELPGRILEERVHQVEQGARLQAAKSGMRFDDSDNHLKAIRQTAQRLLMEEIVLLEIAKAEGLYVVEEAIRQEISRLAKENNEEFATYRQTLEKSGVVPQIERQLLIEQTVGWLLENARITECIMI